jgi:hypothetical protein
VDIPYSQTTGPQQGTQTTGDIAEILERRYGIMQFFADVHSDDVIVPELENIIGGKLENLLMGGPVHENVFEEGDLSGIEHAFRQMLDNREMDGRVPGVPTKAAQMGVSHRMAHPNAKRGPRSSFIDTGQYQAAMRAWIEE